MTRRTKDLFGTRILSEGKKFKLMEKIAQKDNRPF